jgi:hypothetical protein
MSAQQYRRKFSVIVGDNAGGGLDLSDLRVVFNVRRGDYQTPNSADVRIFNVADKTANRIRDEGARLVLQAGYDGNYGLIFDGQIKQPRRGRVDSTDSYIDITAADGDQAYNYSVIALSLAAGNTPSDAVQAFLASMARHGISQGYVPELSTNGRARGRVHYGLTRDELREWAEVEDVLWSIQDGKLTLVPKTSYIPGEVPVISPATGLIGVPEQTPNGIEMRVLLNPALKIGERIKLDSSVNRYRYGLDVPSQALSEAQRQQIKTNTDGMYYVMVANHSGDTRGNEWYTDMICLAVDATVPPGMAPRAAIAPEAASIKRN